MALAPAFFGRRFLGPPHGSRGFDPSLDCGAQASSAVHSRSSAQNPSPSLRSKHPHDAAADPSLRCRRAASRRLRPLSSGLDDNVRMRQQLSPIKDFYGDFPALHKRGTQKEPCAEAPRSDLAGWVFRQSSGSLEPWTFRCPHDLFDSSVLTAVALCSALHPYYLEHLT
ncbi:hypothetical protein SEVIR_8G092001v4 [Setaria viridis]